MYNGLLYPTEFLDHELRQRPEWADALAFTQTQGAELQKRLAAAFAAPELNEAATESEIVEPILDFLGWTEYLTQQTASATRREDVPDYLLFTSDDDKKRALEADHSADRYRFGALVLEAKARDLPLDSRAKSLTDRIPSNQILRYLSAVDVASGGKMRFGVLTNGRLWRLYDQKARSRADGFLELDIQAAFADPDLLALFWLLFRRTAFVPDKGGTFHEQALDRARDWEEQVAKDLRQVVFDEVFPGLLKALWEHDPEKPQSPDAGYLGALRQAALFLLYRLLFVLYAEDRELLPVRDERYQSYSLRKLRDEVAQHIDQRRAFGERAARQYSTLADLFNAINGGDAALGLPPYNGGLFAQTPLLDRANLPDKDFAPLLDRLSRLPGAPPRRINYRDLSVQQLGSIYEGLLEHKPRIEDKGGMTLELNTFARKNSGSYYTPESIVRLTLEKAVGTLIDERRQAFAQAAEQPDAAPETLTALDPAEAILALRICDPAMGSGHFLVSLVDYLADRVLEAIDEAQNRVYGYRSPVSARVAELKDFILNQAREHDWRLGPEQLEEKHIVRRMVLKRCVYGVDKNLMAVELAKVSLWLHTFTVGAPLSFLDHHLRHGDSLFGEFLGQTLKELQSYGYMFLQPAFEKTKPSADAMAEIERLTDADLSQAHRSAEYYQRVRDLTHDLEAILTVYHASKWVRGFDKKKNETERLLFNLYMNGDFGNPVELAAGRAKTEPKGNMAPQYAERFDAFWIRLWALANDEAFLHWQVAFPLVWPDWTQRAGGFDAVVGNPPWDVMKVQQVEWFAARKPEIAYLTKGADRTKAIAKLEGGELGAAYNEALGRAEAASEMARKGGDYPELSGGDTNLYYLFVERAFRLLKPGGVVGLVVPSGIAADKRASDFFRKLTAEGRLGFLYDFENKKVFFPDVDSRFKFCVFVAGYRRFEHTRMAFFLHDAKTADEHAIDLAPEAFELVNPNTGTAPIFRAQADADLTLAVYRRLPVLHDHKKGKTWPVKYNRMFDMTNDSHHFRTKAELEAEGCYAVAPMHYKKGETLFLPLLQGRSIHQFNHRYGGVTVNPDSLMNPFLTLVSTSEQLANPDFYTEPQYWINTEVCPLLPPFLLTFRDISNVTNERTMISAIVSKSGAGNKLPVLLPEIDNDVLILEMYIYFNTPAKFK